MKPCYYSVTYDSHSYRTPRIASSVHVIKTRKDFCDMVRDAMKDLFFRKSDLSRETMLLWWASNKCFKSAQQWRVYDRESKRELIFTGYSQAEYVASFEQII